MHAPLAAPRRVGRPDAEALVLDGLALLGGLATLLHWPAVLRVPLGLAALALVPGAVAERLLRRDPCARLEDRLLAALLLSPPLATAAVVALAAAGIPLEHAAPALGLVAVAALTAVPSVRLARVEVDRVVLATALALGAVVALPAFVDILTRVFGDAIVHAQFVHEIRLRGLPPQDPSYAGLPLTYMWGFHVWAAGLVAATGLSPFWVFPCINAVMATALVLAARTAAEALGGGRGAQRMAALVVPLGMNALGWLAAGAVTLLRAAVGHHAGLATLRSELTSLLITPQANVVAGRLSPGLYFVLSSFLYKYLCANALATGLTYIAAAWAWAAATLREPRSDRMVALAVATLGATAIHPLVGGPAALALVVGLAAAMVEPARRRAAWWTAAAAVLGAALAVPIVRLMLGGAVSAGEPVRLHPVLENLFAFPLVLVVVLPATLWTWSRLRREARAHLAFMLGYAATALLVAAFVELPFLGHVYPVYVAYLALALPAGLGAARFVEWMRARGRARLAWTAVALVLLPTAAIEVAAFARQGHPDGLAGYPATADEVRVFDLLRDRTPVDAVVLDLPFFASSPAAGYAGRRGLFGGMLQADLVGYPHAAMRRRQAAEEDVFFGRGALAADTRAVLRELGAEVYVVARDRVPLDPTVTATIGAPTATASRLDALPGEFVPVVRTATLVLYRWRRDAR